ncbi:tRNA lysidine(34) synthetase TilS [Alphaproteobacteria bacterium]|nr:tRNA lysidine(34) synthetase TilS [Alphaproteobacteria bacterium]
MPEKILTATPAPFVLHREASRSDVDAFQKAYPFFKQRIASLLKEDATKSIAVAVSGGPDSMALLALTQRYATEQHLDLHALIVDHGLRAASQEEAQQTSQWLSDFGIKTHLLDLSLAPITTGIQEKARQARYEILSTQCEKLGIHNLLLGHTQEDQAETLLHRMLKGSGIQGLQGMAEKSFHISSRGYQLTLLRPCLSMPKNQLRPCWPGPTIQDPSNMDPRFSRVRHRLFLQKEPLETSTHLLKTAEKMTQAWDYIRAERDNFLDQHLKIHPWHEGELSLTAFRALHPCLQEHVLSWCLSRFGGLPKRPYTAPHDLLKELCKEMSTLSIRRKTAHGCFIDIRKDQIHFWREPRFLRPLSLPPHEEVIWDKRYVIQHEDKEPREITLKVLGEEGWTILKRKAAFPPMPYSVARGLPSLWHQEQLLWCAFTSYNTLGSPIHMRPTALKTLAFAPCSR